MKNTIYALAFTLALPCLASAEQAVRCQYKPEQYANNRFEYKALGELAIDMTNSSEISQFAKIRDAEFVMEDGYAVRLSGYATKPGGNWVKGGSELLMVATLLQIKPGADGKMGKTVLSQDVSSSDTVDSEKALALVKEGKLITRHHLDNNMYLNMAEQGAKISATMLTGVSVTCEVVTK
jgi:hypothetical protein